MAKVCVTVSLNGFVVHWGGVIYTGTSADKTIGRACGVIPMLEKENRKSLVDGGFAEDPHFILPFTKPQIYPKRLKKGQTNEHYQAAAHAKKVQNTVHGHYRARSEHFFGRSMIGRFCAFKDWRWCVDTLYDAIACVCVAMNIETFLVHGDQGRYAKSTPDYVAEMHAKAERHTQQDKRYPSYEPLRPLRAATTRPTKRQKPTKGPLFKLRAGRQKTVAQVCASILSQFVTDKKKKVD